MKIIKRSLIVLLFLMLSGYLFRCDYRDPVTTKKNQSSSYRLTLSTDRQEIFADNGKTVARISAFLQNEELEPLGGREIYFSVTSGVISSPVVTAANGVAVATFDDEGVVADSVRIIARYSDARNVTVRDTIYIKVSPIQSLVKNISLTARPSVIVIKNPDSSYTSQITAQVVDSLGVPVKNVPVYFSNVTGIGIIAAPADTTNSLGQASVAYHTVPGQLGSVKIAAFVSYQDLGKATGKPVSPEVSELEYPGRMKNTSPEINLTRFPLSKTTTTTQSFFLSDTVEISIVPPSPYTLKVVSSTDTIFADNGVTKADITAILKESSGQPVSGAEINFSSTLGVIQSPVTTDQSGVARAQFTDLGSEADTGRATIVATYQSEFQTAISETTYVFILPKPSQQKHIPDNIQFSVAYDELPAGENGEITSTEVVVVVTDSSGYPADPGYLVTFSANIGYITPFDVLDNEGKASATFSMGTSAGTAIIKARCGNIVDSTVINIQSSIPNYIVIQPSVPNEITVTGSGGIESTNITALIYDANGQLVNLPYLVHFRLGPSPEGANLNNHGIEDSTYSNHGIASVTLNSGTAVGPVKVTATIRISDSLTISASSVPVTIIAGPPAHIYPDFSYLDIEPIGGGVYQMEASAIVQDVWSNPVQDSTHVYFWVTDENGGSIPGVDVVGIGFTGGPNLAGDKYPGVAWTRIYYNSDKIFENVILHALTWGYNITGYDTTIVYDTTGSTVDTIVVIDTTVTDTIYGTNPAQGLPPAILPLYEGTLIVIPDKTFWDFINGSPVQVIVLAYLFDHYQNPVDNGRVMFFSTGGNVITENPTVTNSSGMASAIIEFDQSLCTPIPNTDPQQYNPYTAYVWAQTLDPNQVTSDQVAIELRRSPATGKFQVSIKKVPAQGNR